MMALCRGLPIDYTCYELSHPWTHHCLQAAVNVGKANFFEGFKIYAAFFLLSAVIQRKKRKYYMKLLPKIIRSSIFLAINGSLFIFSFCCIRNGDTFVCNVQKGSIQKVLRIPNGWFPSCLHRFTWRYSVRSQRSAVETSFRMLITRGFIRPLPNGEEAWLAWLNTVTVSAVNCSLRWVRRKDEACHGMVAGFLAGCSSYFYKSSTIALFSASKLAEAVMEPHSLRPAYWKWLLRVTHNKLGLMNRKLLDGFGCNSSKLFPDYWPDYDPRYTSLVRPSRD